MSEIVIASNIDASVNFIEPRQVGYIESRYVRRQNDYFIAYVSSQTGCNRGCRMCHLTTTGQMAYRDCTLQDYLSQVDKVIEHYKSLDKPCRIANVAFMARGEALANRFLLEDSTPILHQMGTRFIQEGLVPKFNVSTIMPKSLKRSLIDVFPLITPTIYWSCYSSNPEWRSKWLPGAMSFEDSLRLLSEYQRVSRKIVKLHGAFIANENDNVEEIIDMAYKAKEAIPFLEYNIVRYNAPDHTSRESDHINTIWRALSTIMPTKIIDRVGEDCMASCGMFYEA